ncbi:hypothetical protein TanjilG_14485 [Lupinus angustifolius]|uniref:Uncharacterized protein n=1 Tax=Lupinus angustifolius TaxID=3871 RepID=A0A394DJV9_LUPAN|nr:hypothetical protein TanjilG_14485 [Lupinus angustifolius]
MHMFEQQEYHKSLYADQPVLPSGFRIILHDYGKDVASPDHVAYLASALGVGTTGNEAATWSVLYKCLDYEQSGS